MAPEGRVLSGRIPLGPVRGRHAPAAPDAGRVPGAQHDLAEGVDLSGRGGFNFNKEE